MAAGKRTLSAELYDVDQLLKSDVQLTFDHRRIIEYGRERMKNKVEYTNIAFEFLPEELMQIREFSGFWNMNQEPLSFIR